MSVASSVSRQGEVNLTEHPPLTKFQLQQFYIFPYCISKIEKYDYLIRKIPHMITTWEPYYLDATKKLLSASITAKIIGEFKAQDRGAYQQAIKEHLTFRLCIILYQALVGNYVFADVKNVQYHRSIKKTGVVLPQSFEHPLFRELPQDIRDMITKTLLLQEKFEISDFREPFVKAVGANQELLGQSLIPKEKYQRFTSSPGCIEFKEYNFKLLGNSSEIELELNKAQFRLSSSPIGKIRKIATKFTSIYMGKVFRNDCISTRIFFWDGRQSTHLSTSRSKIAFANKASNGKPLVIKREVGNNYCIMEEAQKLTSLHKYVNENLEVLFLLYPEAFTTTTKGVKLTTFQSCPYVFLNDRRMMITDRCDTTALSLTLNYNDQIKILCRELINIDHEGLSKMRMLVNRRKTIDYKLHLHVIEKKEYEISCNEISKEISDLNRELDTKYEKILDHVKKFDKKLIQERQKTFLELGLSLVAALAVLHYISWYHGDLKPENIFINKKNNKFEPVIGDWYSANFLRNAASIAPFQAGEEIGILNRCTETYVSADCFDPIEKSIKEFDQQGLNVAAKTLDRYGIGSILYGLLTGVRMPHHFVLKKKNNGMYFTNVVPLPAAFENPAYLLLPQPVQDALKKMISSEQAYSIHSAYVAFKDSIHTSNL